MTFEGNEESSLPPLLDKREIDATLESIGWWEKPPPPLNATVPEEVRNWYERLSAQMSLVESWINNQEPQQAHYDLLTLIYKWNLDFLVWSLAFKLSYAGRDKKDWIPGPSSLLKTALDEELVKSRVRWEATIKLRNGLSHPHFHYVIPITALTPTAEMINELWPEFNP